MHASTRRITFILLALFFSFAVLGIGGGLSVNLIVVSGFLILYTKGLFPALQWSATGGLVFETVSPFPFGAFLLAFLLSITITHYVRIHYFTHRTLP